MIKTLLIPLGIAILMIHSLASVGQAALVITEIMANPSGVKDDATNNSDEWFEIFNSSDSVDLSTVKFDNDSDASDGVSLTGILHQGQYAVFGNTTVGSFLSTFGALPVAAKYFELPSPWNVLSNTGGTISLYSTVTNSTLFSLTYGTTVDGRSLEYVGTNVSEVSPYLFDSSHWQNGSLAHAGNSGDLHSAGFGNANAAPEPAAYAMLMIAACGLFVVTRRQRRQQTST